MTPTDETTATATGARALLVVDVQNDFVEGGSLGVDGGREVARAISAHLDRCHDEYALVVASRDWHHAGETNGGHFAAPGAEPDFTTTWPVHCVSGERGSEFAPDLDLTHVDLQVKKGQGVPAYSAFEGTAEDGRGLAAVLREAGVGSVDVVGIATDHCVRATALDARQAGFAVRLLDRLHAGVAPGTSAAARAEMQEAGVAFAEPVHGSPSRQPTRRGPMSESTDDQRTDADEGGQVSESANLQGGPEEVTPGDATAGHPDSGDGDGPQEGTAGPDAPPQDGRPSGSE